MQDQHKLGSVGTDPKFAVAWKPPPQTAVTVLRGIQCNIARTGVAHLRAGQHCRCTSAKSSKRC